MIDTSKPDVDALMARISELEILVTAWQSQATSANAIIHVLRNDLDAAMQQSQKLWERLRKERQDRQVEHDALIDLIPPAEVPPTADQGKIVSLTERAFTRVNTLNNVTFCPQCCMVMSSQCGARCDSCGFKSSCSMEPT